VGSIQSKSFDNPDEVREFPLMASQLTQVGPITVGRAVIEPGWRWSTSIGALSGDALCQVHHITVVLAGRIAFEMEDGEVAEVGANTLIDVPPGHDAWVVGDERVEIIDLYGYAGDVGVRADHQRAVTTILMSDIVDSTAIARELGDRRWRQLLAEHDRLCRAQLERFGGHEVNTTGDGFIATFASAAAALRCAASVREKVTTLGLAVRIGVHTGEVELVADDVHGLTVHAAARIMGLAEPSEVLTSELTRNLVDGSGLLFQERGEHEVKGFGRPIAVFALA
jgi:class 3 adenylate cyclase